MATPLAKRPVPAGTRLGVLLVAAGLLTGAPSRPAASSLEDVMHRMSDRLAAAQSFSFSTVEKHERRRGGGKTEIQFSRDVFVRRPDRARFRVTEGDGAGLTATYDGAKFTVLWPAEKAYARVPMPPTLDAALDKLGERFRMPLPVGDLLYSSPYDVLMSADTKGQLVGREKVEGMACDHLAFTHER